MEEWEAGVVRWEWDPARRMVDGYGGDETLLGSRPYTPDENAAADNYALFLQREANRATIASRAVTAVNDLALLLTQIDVLLSTADATINANPAQYIKASAQRVKKVAQIQKSMIRYVFNHLDQAD